MANPQPGTIVALETDLVLCLQSWDQIQNINIVQQRKMRLQNMADFATIYQTPRNGCAGIGIMVEMPTFLMSNNLSGPGPQTERLVTLLVVECPPINLQDGTGTGTDAESLCDLLLPFMHQWLIDGQGEMYPQSAPIVPANDLPAGCLGYRVQMKMQHAPLNIMPRLTLPLQTIDSNFNVTLTALGGLTPEIYWTVDNSPPCPANSTAMKYNGPFSVQAGQTIRWQSWLSGGYIPSTIGSALILP